VTQRRREPVNISADVGHFHVASDYEATREVETAFRIGLEQLMIVSERIAEHLIQSAHTCYINSLNELSIQPRNHDDQFGAQSNLVASERLPRVGAVAVIGCLSK